MTAITETMRLVQEAGELGEQIVTEFLDTFKEVEVEYSNDGGTPTCSRCGAALHYLTESKHLEWHKNLSFQLFVLQTYVKDHLDLHEQISKELLEILEEQ